MQPTHPLALQLPPHLRIRRPIWAMKPWRMGATDRVAPQLSHCRKYNRVLASRISTVSGDRHDEHMTYSRMYRRSTFSIPSDVNRPLMTSRPPSCRLPVVPSSALMYASRWSCCRWMLLQMSPKFINTVFFDPSRAICGGRSVIRFRPPPVASAGFFPYRNSNARATSSACV